MLRSIHPLPLCLLLLIALPACDSTDGNDQTSTGNAPDASDTSNTSDSSDTFVRNIGPDAAADLLESESDLVVLDVRTPDEYEDGHISGATLLNFYEDNFDQQLDQLDKDQPYLVHCASGGRSSDAREKMKEMGFTKIYHLDGGFQAWQQAGKPVEE